jgi:hypothetical protein
MALTLLIRSLVFNVSHFTILLKKNILSRTTEWSREEELKSGHNIHLGVYNSMAFSPQENYTDRATAACRRSLCQLLRKVGVTWSAQRIHTAVNIGFLDRSRYFFRCV